MEPAGTAEDNDASSSSTSWSSTKSRFVDMGYASALVEKAIRIHGTENEADILDYVLAYQAANYLSGSSDLDSSQRDSFPDPEGSECDDTYNFGKTQVNNQEHIASSQFSKDPQLGDSQADYIKAQLLEMGYSESEVSSAVDINGIDSPIVELVDFIDAHRRGVENYEFLEANQSFGNKGLEAEDENSCLREYRKRKQEDIVLKAGSSSIKKKMPKAQEKKLLKNKNIRETVQSEQVELNDENLMLPYPSLEELIGFGVPGYPGSVEQRPKEIKASMHGPPFFYYEHVAMAPKDVWETITRHFGGIGPEFVDSKSFSVCMRPRGYVHNLPIDGRSRVLPLPPMTIHEAFPHTKKFWPPWDNREKLNCMCPGRVSDVLCQALRSILTTSEGNPTLHEQSHILENCKKWDLVWVGPDQMAPLEPNEIELILGFDKDHTRGASSRTDRIQCLGNAFQIDTVAYHLSALKLFYPDGLNVLSLFSGIGGAEVALHRLGIHLKCVVSVEICPKNRLILSSWWIKTNQTGRLIQKEDVQHLTRDVLQELVDMVGGFDLVIGGSPCNNLPGNNRIGMDGLEAKRSSIFYEFPRILNEVRQIMRSKRMRA